MHADMLSQIEAAGVGVNFDLKSSRLRLVQSVISLISIAAIL